MRTFRSFPPKLIGPFYKGVGNLNSNAVEQT